MKRVLLTGATGFVGANLARRLLRDGHEVHLLVRPGHAAWRIEGVREHVRLWTAELADADAVDQAVGAARPDWVFHLAAYGAYSSQTDLPRMVRTNVLGTAHLVEACLRAGVEAFVHTGSSSEYGVKGYPPPEDDALEPNSPYAVTKASATLYCRYTSRSRDVHLPTLRLYSVYGPYEEPSRLVPTLIVNGRRGRLPPLVDPDVARDFVFVDDVCDAYLRAAGRPTAERGAVYNVGTGTQTRLRDVVGAARQVFNIAEEPRWGSMPNRHWDTKVWVADNRKIVHELGWRPRTEFAEGLRHTADWLARRAELLPRYERPPA
jgi:dolichol-phosphate mannosyltransferase